MQGFEAARHRTRPQRRPGPRRPGDALQLPCPEVLQLEKIANKSSRALGDDDHVRLGDPLQGGSSSIRLWTSTGPSVVAMRTRTACDAAIIG